MLSLNQCKLLVEAFVKDVCCYLDIDPDSIRVLFSPKVREIYGVPQMTEVLADDTIVVGENFLMERGAKNSMTPVRFEVYSQVRYIYLRRTAGKVTERKQTLDYAIALCFLKGLQLPCMSFIDPDVFFAGALKILYEEFSLRCRLFRTDDGLYKVTLHSSDSYRLESQIMRPVALTGVEPKDGEKGSMNNPFDNVYEAMDYLKKIEAIAYERDPVMNHIAGMKFFYDHEYCHFRVNWASSYVAHHKTPFPEKSFVVSKMAPLDDNKPEEFYFNLKPNLYKRKFLYRGQASYYTGRPCVPSLFRDEAHNDVEYYLDFLIFSQEMEVLIRSHPLVQLLEGGVELLHDIFRFRVHYTGLAQHYYNKSVFLDFTSDLDVMKFFATTKYDAEKDEYMPVTDDKETGVIFYYELKFPEAFQQHDGYAVKTIGKHVFSRSGLQRGFLLEMCRGVDLKRDVVEVKKVFFRHNGQISLDIFEESNKGNAYFPDDILQHAWHDRFKERYRNRVVSRKAVSLNVERNEGETEESITEKLSALGITVDDYEPAFTKEELDNFYKDIDRWWEDFCSDIYFVAAENNLYRQALKDVINDSRYRWAFKI